MSNSSKFIQVIDIALVLITIGSLKKTYPKKNLPRKTAANKLAPIAAASFLWSRAEQKDIAESGTKASLS